MERREKLEFILEQMRLLRVKENWDMLAIVSKKVNTKWLDDATNEDLKFKFYELMIQYCLQTNKYLEVSKHYRSLYLSPSVTPPRSTPTPAASSSSTSESKDGKKKETEKKETKPTESGDVKMDEDTTSSSTEPTKDWRPLLRNIIFFTILAPYDNEQSDILHRILKDEDERLSQLTDCQNLAKCFTTPELTRWPRIESLYGPGLRETRVFGSNGVKGVEGDISQEITSGQGEKRFADLHKRVVEHNIRIISKYYKRITLQRLSELLDLSKEETESSLCKMVVDKNVTAKIDRPSGVVDFTENNKGTYKVLNEWSRDVGKLMVRFESELHSLVWDAN
jgi:26S proteasome regulatory subunit N5